MSLTSRKWLPEVPDTSSPLFPAKITVLGLSTIVGGFRFDWSPDRPDRVFVYYADGHIPVDQIAVPGEPAPRHLAGLADRWHPEGAT
jgi:hypothetical protein